MIAMHIICKSSLVLNLINLVSKILMLPRLLLVPCSVDNIALYDHEYLWAPTQDTVYVINDTEHFTLLDRWGSPSSWAPRIQFAVR